MLHVSHCAIHFRIFRLDLYCLSLFCRFSNLPFHFCFTPYLKSPLFKIHWTRYHSRFRVHGKKLSPAMNIRLSRSFLFIRVSVRFQRKKFSDLQSRPTKEETMPQIIVACSKKGMLLQTITQSKKAFTTRSQFYAKNNDKN